MYFGLYFSTCASLRHFSVKYARKVRDVEIDESVEVASGAEHIMLNVDWNEEFKVGLAVRGFATTNEIVVHVPAQGSRVCNRKNLCWKTIGYNPQHTCVYICDIHMMCLYMLF